MSGSENTYLMSWKQPERQDWENNLGRERDKERDTKKKCRERAMSEERERKIKKKDKTSREWEKVCMRERS